MATQRKTWTRDELLVAFNLYCRTTFGRLHQRNPDIVALAQQLQRTPGSVAMKLCNLASLDPIHRERNISGLRNASASDKSIYKEFEGDWEALAAESEAAIHRLGLRLDVHNDNDEENPIRYEGPTESARTIRTRRVQSLFRATVLASYDCTCAVSGINIPSLLQASHIIPWAKSERHRLDPRNGIALSALHDRAFDRGLITFDENFRVVVSGRLRIGNPSEIHRMALLKIEGKPIRMPTRFAPDPDALAYHRKRIFVA